MRQIPIQNSTLVENRKGTFLSSIAEAGKSELLVESIFGFTVNQILLIGEIGNEKSEIIATHNSTAPTGSKITLATNLKFNHPQGTKIYILDWNEIEVAWSAEEDSPKHTLATIPIQPDRTETVYEDTTKVEGFYFVRFINSIVSPSRYSNYSAPVPWEGFKDNTVASIINIALKENFLEKFTKFIDHDFCIDKINDCLKFIAGEKKKWTHLQDFDHLLGYTDRGINSLPLPYNVWRQSYKAFLDVRIGSNIKLTYKDKREFNDLMIGVNRAKVTTPASVGDTEITVDRVLNLDSSGQVMIGGQLISYNGMNSNNVLLGIPSTGKGSITADIPAGSQVWQGSYQEGTPRYYTVYGGKFFWYPMTSVSKPRQAVVADFWTEAPVVEHDNDRIDIYRYDMVKHYLIWAVRMMKNNNGIKDLNDGDYIVFRNILMRAIRTDVTGQKYKTEPKLNRIMY